MGYEHRFNQTLQKQKTIRFIIFALMLPKSNTDPILSFMYTLLSQAFQKSINCIGTRAYPKLYTMLFKTTQVTSYKQFTIWLDGKLTLVFNDRSGTILDTDSEIH